MINKGRTYVAARQVAFYAPVHGGKYHAAWMITDTAVCGYAGELDKTQVIRTEVGKVPHLICCKRCQRSAVHQGVSGHGIQS